MKDELLVLVDKISVFLKTASFKRKEVFQVHEFSTEPIKSIVLLLNQILTQIYLSHEENKIFLENSAHELRNTLLGLNHYAAHFNVRDYKEIPEKSVRNFFYIIARTRHLTEYILLFSSLGEQAQWYWKKTSLSELVERESHLFVYHPYAARVSYHLSTEVTIFANPIALRFIIQNLILNALDAIDETGTVLVSLKESNGQIILTVADNGKGLSSEQKMALYKKFCHVSKPFGSGLGVGFFLSQKIITLHGGHISIEKGLEGKGVSIHVIFAVNS